MVWFSGDEVVAFVPAVNVWSGRLVLGHGGSRGKFSQEYRRHPPGFFGKGAVLAKLNSFVPFGYVPGIGFITGTVPKIYT